MSGSPASGRPLVVTVADLLRRPGEQRAESCDAVLPGLATSGSTVPDGAPVSLVLELRSVNEGIVATGTVSAPWAGECRRCLRPITGTTSASVLEVFEDDPVEGETLPLTGVEIDLEPLAREAVMLELPLAPLCREDCAGLCPVCGTPRDEADCGHETAARDERWAALDELRFEE